MRSFVSKLTILSLVLALVGVVAPVAPASAVTPAAVRYLGDNRVVIRAVECTEFDTVCGPRILLELADWPSEDHYYASSATLTGPTGARVTLEEEGFSLFADETAKEMDPSYSGYSAMWRAATSMLTTKGTYTLRIHWDQSGYWWCSVNNPDVCTWLDDVNVNLVYVFTWTGAGTAIRPVLVPSQPVMKKPVRYKKKATVRWSAPVRRAPGITGYVIKKGSTARTLPATTAATTWRGLKPGKKYTFKVRARNIAGYGEWASVVLRTKS